MSELRLIARLITVSLLLAYGCDADQRRPGWELYQDLSVEGHRFIIPAEHVPGELPVTFAGTAAEATANQSFRVHFSPGWLAAHIDGYQPVLNDTFQALTFRVYVGEQAAEDFARIFRRDQDLWYGRRHFAQRVLTGRIEPNTGLHIITRMPEAPEQTRFSWRLVETLPNPTREYPSDPPWRPMVCSNSKPALIPTAKNRTQCLLKGSATPLVFMRNMAVSGENLRIRDRITEGVAEEIRRWLRRGEEFAEREENAD